MAGFALFLWLVLGFHEIRKKFAKQSVRGGGTVEKRPMTCPDFQDISGQVIETLRVWQMLFFFASAGFSVSAFKNWL